MKRILCLVLALVLCLTVFAGCGSKDAADTPITKDEGSQAPSIELQGGTSADDVVNGAATATPPPESDTVKYKDTLVQLVDDKTARIDMFTAGASNTQLGNINHMYLDTLIDLTVDGKYEPCLATEWEANDDYTEFTFKLRDDVYFHNGDHLTADDFVYTAERGAATPGCAVYTTAIKFKSIEAVDDYTLKITLTEPNYDFWYNAANIGGLTPASRKACEADPENGAMIGTGPYYIADFVSSESITFKRNDNYFGEKPITETFIMRYVAEETARYIMFDNDEADFIGVQSVNIPKYEADPNFDITGYVVNNCGYIALNCSKAPLDDINLRLAINYAMNDEEIALLGFSGYAQPHDSGCIWGWTTPYKNTNLVKRTQDIDLAKEYLAKSSYKGETLQICAGMPHTVKIGTVIMAQLQAVGINCELYQTDTVTLGSMSNWGSNELDIIVNSQLFTPLASSINIAVTEQNYNKAAWSNAEAIELAEKNPTVPDGPEREAMYYRIQELIYEEVPYISTVHFMMFIGTHAGTGGLKCHTNAYTDFSMAYRVNEN